MKKTIKILSVIMIFTTFLCCSCSKAPASGNLFDFTFSINEKSVTLPEKISAFTDLGFSFPEDFNLDKNITPGNLESTYLTMENEDNWIKVEIFNNNDQELALKDCPVGRVEYYFEGDIEIKTAGNFELCNKTLDDVIKMYGTPFSQTDYSNYTEVIYDIDPENSIYDRYTFRFDSETKIINYLDITMFNM